MGSPYTAQLAATGGDEAYTWSLANGSLPSGLTLTREGVIAGLPSASGTYSFVVQVSDMSTLANTSTQTLSITIALLAAGTNNSLLSGRYAFYMVGFEDLNLEDCGNTGEDTPEPMMMVGSFVADGNGNITQGEYDSYVACEALTNAHAFTGTYAVGVDHRGKLVMTNIINNQSTFAFSVAQIQDGVAQQTQFIEFDDDANGLISMHGSGTMQLQDPSAFTTAGLNGSYVFGLTGQNPAAGLMAFDGAGNISGPSVSGTYGTPDTVSGRTTFTVNGQNYVMYIVNAQQAFLFTNSPVVGAAALAAGQMRRQQSAGFNDASLSGALVGYGVTPYLGVAGSGDAILYSLTADGAGTLTGLKYTGASSGPATFTTTYSVSSNGLALLGTGDVLWLYAPNAGYSVSSAPSSPNTTPSLWTYETAAGGPFTFDVTTGIYSVGTLPPTNGVDVSLLPLENGSYMYAGSGNTTVTLDDYMSPLDLGGEPNGGLSTTTSTVPVGSLPVCTPACGPLIPLSNSRAVSLAGTNNPQIIQNILIFQQ
jgi:hypothetical protein